MVSNMRMTLKTMAVISILHNFGMECDSFYNRRSAKNMTNYIGHQEQRNKLVILIKGSWNDNCTKSQG